MLSSEISWQDFEKVELRVGTILEVLDFPEARKPAYKLKVDFGEFGLKWSSAQITKQYSKEELIQKQIIGVVNFLQSRSASSCLSFWLPALLMRPAILFLQQLTSLYQTDLN
ncbi:MAG: tRNA-binding protein [Sphingobacteriaceae bacterium]|jgi:tRNA-binding protein|nr:tRNA-binding protein [Sphingobacteriaceae bacterium]